MRSSTRILFVLLLASSVVLAACGSNSSSTTTTTSMNMGSDTSSAPDSGTATPAGVTLSGPVKAHGSATAANGEIQIDLYDNYFQPSFIKVDPGKTYKVKLSNEGHNFHTFTVASLGIDKSLKAGDTAEVSVTAPATGFAEFICKPHAGLGMRGALYTS